MQFNNENFRKDEHMQFRICWGFFSIVSGYQRGAESIRVLSKKTTGNISLIQPEQDNVNIEEAVLKQLAVVDCVSLKWSLTGDLPSELTHLR